MARNDKTSAIIDGILKIIVTGGAVSGAIVAPGTITFTEKPVMKYLDKLDQRDKERELRRVIRYMQRRGYLIGDYEHGLKVTKAGKRRLETTSFDKLAIQKPAKWDKKWRLVIFDIPENKRQGRISLTDKLKRLGFQALQQSVWVHPFPCRNEIIAVCIEFGLTKYITYIETDHIDNDYLLRERFSHILRK